MSLDQVTLSDIQLQDLSTLDQVISEGTVFSEFVSFLVANISEDKSPQTVKGYKLKLGQFVRFTSEVLKVTDPVKVTDYHIRLYLIEKQKSCGMITVNNHYRCIRRFFNWMVEQKKIDKNLNPIENIKPPKVPKYMIKPFTPDQIRVLLAMCDDAKFLGARNKALIWMFIDTGLRLSEMTNIELKDINIKRQTIRVMGKGNKERVVRLGKRAWNALIKYNALRRSPLPCLWLSEERRPLTLWGIELMVHDLGIRAGIKGVRCSPHTFRHFFGTQSLKNGANVYDVQNLLGHATLDMTKNYVRSITSEDAVINHQRFSPGDNL